jgi:chloramphenicol-sensitive protein RarD
VSGIQAGVIAFVLWGLVPLFWHLLGKHSPWELVAHRAVWSLPLLAGVLLVQRRTSEWLRALREPRIWLTSFLLGGNWLLYVYLAVHARLVEASFGYFIVPLLNTLLGVLFLGETLRPLQKAAMGIAALALLFPLADLTYFPWAGIAIAVLWSSYGFVRKGLPVEGMAALTAETAIGTPLALGFLIYRHALPAFRADSSLLFLTGVVTVVPLLFYGYAVKRISLSLLGLLQYLGPTLTFLLGVFVYKEHIPWHRYVLIGTIWLAILLYIADSLKRRAA